MPASDPSPETTASAIKVLNLLYFVGPRNADGTHEGHALVQVLLTAVTMLWRAAPAASRQTIVEHIKIMLEIIERRTRPS